MRTPLYIAALAAVLGTAACGAKTDSSNAAAEGAGANVAIAPPAEMPPPAKSSKSYRCDDNSVVYVDLFEGDTQASVRTKPADPPIILKTATAGTAMVSGDGAWSITPAGAKLKVTAPGKKAQSCAAA